ncbi:hypothetical protein DFH08DRAFT_93144 [Mycena albidolilacea]|uniref:Uncharacterized protein n=1 Tax=Mycena albidolilacea TaxID=1033008 RepID=A0AAD7AAE7_9AGAR|nr:hypothetical protein DFH08DRAFT_93144 [Mycena albidolilacea]
MCTGVLRCADEMWKKLLMQAPAHVELRLPQSCPASWSTKRLRCSAELSTSFWNILSRRDSCLVLPTASDPTIKAGLGDISFGFTSTLRSCFATLTVVHNPILGSCQTSTQAQPTPCEKDLADLAEDAEAEDLAAQQLHEEEDELRQRPGLDQIQCLKPPALRLYPHSCGSSVHLARPRCALPPGNR